MPDSLATEESASVDIGNKQPPPSVPSRIDGRKAIMREIDQTHYEHHGFEIFHDGEYGTWTAYDPNGEYLATINDGLQEAMIYIETAAYRDG